MTLRSLHGRVQSRAPADFYPTPPASTAALLQVERFPGRIWEPACGDGGISRVLERHGHEVISTDLVDRGYGTAGMDFLQSSRAAAPAIVTNPPFSLATEFVLHARALGIRHVAMFLRLAFLEGQERRDLLWRDHPPARVWVFSARQTLWRGDQKQPRDGRGSIAFAWFVWAPRSKNTVLGWI